MRTGWAHGPSRRVPPLGDHGGVSSHRRRRPGSEAGVTSLEFVGIFLVVGTVVAAIAFAVNGQRVTDGTASALCSITGGGGCRSVGGAPGAGAPPVGARCVGAPSGAAGPVRGLVPVDGADPAAGPVVSVMGDGTYRMSGAGRSRPADTTWVGRTFGSAAAGAEPFLTGGDPRVWSASEPAALAELLTADRAETWSDSLVGDGGSVVSRAADAVTGLVGARDGLPAPTAVYTDTSPEAGLSLNAYDQTLALDAGGEAVGTLRYADGSSTEYVGVSETPTAGVARASDLVPMLLEVDRGPTGEVTSVRTVTDRDITSTGATTRSGSLYVTHLDVTGSDSPVVSMLASTVGATNLMATAGQAPTPFSQSGPAFVGAATATGYVTRQAPAGQVVVDDPNADPLTAGVARVMRSAAPESWDGTGWGPRPAGCAS